MRSLSMSNDPFAIVENHPLVGRATSENQAGIIPASPEPSQMTNEALATHVRDGMTKLAQLIPYVKELKARFAALPRSKADILGCKSWKEFCERVLNRTDSAVRKALNNADKEPRKPKILLAALDLLKTVVPPKRFRDVRDDCVRFMATEDGKVLLSGANMQDQMSITLDVPAPKPDFMGMACTGPEDEKLFVRILQLVADGCPGMPPWGFLVPFKQLLLICQKLDGDPTIIYHGQSEGVTIEEGNGELRFLYLPSLDDFKALLPYTGNFLPELKPGDDVFVTHGNRADIQTVKQVTGTKIIVGSGTTFDREGHTDGASIVRLATDEDRQLVAAQQAKEQAEQKAKQIDEAHA